MQTIPDDMWAKVLDEIKRYNAHFYVGMDKGNPHLCLQYHVEYGEYASNSISYFVEKATDYEYEDGEFKITLKQMTSLEDLYIEQLNKETDQLEKLLAYNTKVYKNA